MFFLQLNYLINSDVKSPLFADNSVAVGGVPHCARRRSDHRLAAAGLVLQDRAEAALPVGPGHAQPGRAALQRGLLAHTLASKDDDKGQRSGSRSVGGVLHEDGVRSVNVGKTSPWNVTCLPNPSFLSFPPEAEAYAMCSSQLLASSWDQ